MAITPENLQVMRECIENDLRQAMSDECCCGQCEAAHPPIGFVGAPPKNYEPWPTITRVIRDEQIRQEIAYARLLRDGAPYISERMKEMFGMGEPDIMAATRDIARES